MSWWHRNRDAVQARQADAEAAVIESQRQLQTVRSLKPEVDKRVGILQRLNHENGFSERLELAYHGRA